MIERFIEIFSSLQWRKARLCTEFGFLEAPGVSGGVMRITYDHLIKSGNDLYRVRENYHELILFGGIEKECLNAGNEALIKPEIEAKQELVRAGRYFPNADHAIQPLATFENLCKFMTLLHEITENPKCESLKTLP